jgi:hypothetical protein
MLKPQISISGANFSAVENEADFFNKISPKLPVATGRFWPKTAAHGRPLA